MPILRSQAFFVLRCLSFAAVALTTLGSEAATTSIVSGLATRTGVTVPLLVIDSTGDTPAPGATLILFTGGNGQLHLLDSVAGREQATCPRFVSDPPRTSWCASATTLRRKASTSS